MTRHERRRAKKIGKQFWDKFEASDVAKADCCSICNSAFPNGCVTYVGFSSTGTTIKVGACCRTRIKTELAYGLFLIGEDPWILDDRKWFAENTRRTHRVRRPFPGEFSDIEYLYHPQVIIRQLEPGNRRRFVFGGCDGELLPNVDGLLHAAYDLFMASPNGTVDPWAIGQLAMKYVDAEKGVSS